VGPENLKPIDELKSLERQIELVNDLAGLKPIFFRLEEIAKQNANDFDVQLAVGDLKQHLVNRGAKLKEMKDAKPKPSGPAVGPPAPIASPPPPAARPVPPSPPPAPPSPAPRAATPVPPVSPPVARPSQPPLPAAPTVKPPAPPPVIPATNIPQSPQGSWATTENAPVSPAPGSKAPLPPPPKPPAQASKPAAPKPPSPPSGDWKRPVMIGSLIGVVLVAAVAIGVSVHKRRLKAAALVAAVHVDIATTPPGASVKVTGDTQCTSNCSLDLVPGSYQITAFLDGYEPAASSISVNPLTPASINLTLEPQAQSLRILTDLDQAKVAIDDQPPADLQDGQFIVDRVAPGTHTAKVTSKNGDASFSFEIADAKEPSITGPVTVHTLNAVLVASFGNQAHVVTSSGPLKLAVNGQAEADASPAGVDLKTFQSGVDELLIGEGTNQSSLKESFGPAPMLTVSLKSGVSTGTLIVSTGEDDVHVFLNNKDVGRRTQRGQLRIPYLGSVLVRVAKDGFDAPPVQTADVKKGGETRLEFKLKALPQFATLQITGGTPGAQVLIDNRNLGTVGPDGSFSNGTIAPGDHAIELRRDQYGPHRFTRTFHAGQTTAISGGDAILSANAPPPAPTPAPLPPKPEPAVVAVAPKEPARPAPKAGTMEDWDDPSAWKMQDGVYVHQGKGFIGYKLPPNGVFTFTVELIKGGNFLHGGKVSWCLQYMDAKDYSLFEMDNKNFWGKVVSKGKTTERTHAPLNDLAKQKSFTIQIEVTPERVVHKLIMAGGEAMNLDVWAETGRNFSEGKFGFLVSGNDEIGLTEFKFQPK
jgi:hypothetical protein